MSNPIDSGSGVSGTQGPAEAGATDDAGTVEEAADAFRTAVTDAAAGAESTAADDLATQIARRIHKGELDPYQASELFVEGLAEQHFQALDPTTRGALAVDVRTVLMDDAFFVMELEQLLGDALARIV